MRRNDCISRSVALSRRDRSGDPLKPEMKSRRGRLPGIDDILRMSECPGGVRETESVIQIFLVDRGSLLSYKVFCVSGYHRRRTDPRLEGC